MRLGQLARKLALPPSEITAYLASQQMSIVDGANTRLDENQVTAVLQRFAPDLLSTGIQTEADEPVEVAEIPAPSDELTEQPAAAEQPPVEEGNPETVSTEKPEEIETIKAPKVTLSGLKVLGKIELPEKKKKPETEASGIETPASETDENTVAVSSPPRERRRPDHKRSNNRDQRPKKNPIALAREREERAAEEKKKEEQRLKKERQTENYMRRVQAKAPTKAARIIKEDVIDSSSVDLRPAPKTWLGKFWRWFRS